MHTLFRSVASLIPTVLIVVTIIFMMVRLVPGDPATVILGDYATQENLDAMRQRLGLDRPIAAQFGMFLADLARGDFGNSLMTGRPVINEVTAVFGHTLALTVAGVTLATVLGVPLGVIAAVNRGKLADLATMLIAMIGVSTPVFVVALLLILLFSVQLQWLPAIGVGEAGSLQSLLRHLALPALALGLETAAVVARITRSSLLDVLSQDYIRTAKAKGLSNRLVVYKHGLRNAMVQVVTVVGTEFSRLLGGAVVLETVFARAGMGKLLVDAIYQRDYPQIQATIAVFAFVVIIANILVDLLYSRINPRIRYA